MNGLFLGLFGGVVAGAATILGALPAFFKDRFNKNFILKIRLDFIAGLLLTITAIGEIYPEAVEKNIVLGFAAFFLGAIFLILSKIILKNALETIATNSIAEKEAIFLFLMVMMKNIPVGLAAGASMNMSNSGVGNTLLTVIALHNFFDGIALFLCFLPLGFDPLFAMTGAIVSGLLAIAASLFGEYISQNNMNILSVIMAFAGGALVSEIMREAFSLVKKEFKNIVYNPGFVSAVVVMLIFIVWKEIL